EANNGSPGTTAVNAAETAPQPPPAMRKNYYAIGADVGSLGLVRVFDATTGTILGDFLPYGPGYLGGVSVAVGDINGDGIDDLVTGTGSGASHVKVFSGATLDLLARFLAYPGAQGGGDGRVGGPNRQRS